MRQTPTSGISSITSLPTITDLSDLSDLSRQVQSGGGASDTHQIVGQDSLEPLAIGALLLQTMIYNDY